MYDYDKQQRYFSVSPANNANEMNNFFKTKTENCVDKWFVGLLYQLQLAFCRFC